MNSLSILQFGSWGFTITLSAGIFAYFGRQIDLYFSTEPQFMLGLMMLAIVMCIGRLYKTAMDKKDLV